MLYNIKNLCFTRYAFYLNAVGLRLQKGGFKVNLLHAMFDEWHNNIIIHSCWKKIIVISL